MDSKWRNGSIQFIDFTVTLKDPDGGLTLAEVQALTFDVAVTQSQETPARAATDWVVPSVEKEVVEVTGTFVVTIRHLYTAAHKGLNAVWVKFGPTPEEPIYQAATFVVL
jgi:hypothetical protein